MWVSFKWKNYETGDSGSLSFYLPFIHLVHLKLTQRYKWTVPQKKKFFLIKKQNKTKKSLEKGPVAGRETVWQRTPVFLPGESQGRGSLMGCHLWGRTESDTTEAI